MTNRLKKWLYGNVFCAVEHTGQSNSNLLSLLVVKQKKDTLDIVDATLQNSLENIAKQIPKNTGVSLIVNTDKVLSKTIETAILDDDLLYKTFPTLKLSDFYYEIVRNEQISLVSVCRKSDVDKIVKEYTDIGLQPLSFTLGNSVAFQLENYISDESIYTSNAQIVFNKLGISKVSVNSTIEKSKYRTNDIELSNLQILAFGACLQSITSNKTISNFDKINEEQKNQFLQKKLFQKGLITGLGFLFILLLINMLFFSSYQTKLNHWRQKNTTDTQLKTQLNTIQEEVLEQTKQIDKLFQTTGTHTTYILDDLIAELPKTISLENIQYQPLQKKIKAEQEILIDTNNLFVDGTSISDAKFTDWVNKLEQKKWVDSVVILEYGIKKKNTKFSIQIKIKDAW